MVLLPVMPLYAASLGGREAHVGFIIGVFALAAMVPRPIAGELADRVGRRPLVLLGTAIFALASLGYVAVHTLPALFLLRLFHGVGMGFGPTAATVMVADLTPPERRGAAMGVFGLAQAVGLAAGPYLGAALVQRAGFPVTFLAAATIEGAALALAWTLPETQPAGGGAAPAGPAAARAGGAATRLARRWFHAAAVYPAGLLLALYLSYGGVISFLPLFAARRELGNPGVFFTVLAIASVLVRGPAGRLSDRVGRRAVIAPALGLASVGLVLLGFAQSSRGLLGAATLYGIAFGAAQPALLAMTADRVTPETRGRAMGTFYTAWELGISGGSVLLGLCATRFGFSVMWWVAAVAAGVGALGACSDLGRRRG
jgi:multidrug resistance protein